MSTAAFPSLAGLGWNVTRSEIWKTRIQASISGKEVRLADWSYPRHQWQLTFDFLRQGAFSGSTYTEFAQLCGFFNLRAGGYDSFLYEDPDDNSVTGQGIGSGDGATTVFQMVRAFGGYAEPILAPNVVSAVYLNGTVQSSSSYSVTQWGTSNANGPGQLIFNSAPSAGVTITADFSFYFPCRFDKDQLDFDKFMQSLYQQKKVSFTSIK